MATIITKNSSTASSVPAAGSLQQGELAVNVTDKKLYTKDSSAAVVKLVGSLGNQEANAVAITGGTINGTAIGGTTPAAAAFTTASASGGFTGNLTGNASTVTNGVYTTGSYADPSWITSLAGSKITGNISGNAANVTGTVAIANGGTGLTALGTGVQTALGQTVTGSGGIVLAASPSLTTPNLGTPSAVTLTNATGLPVSTGISGLGTNVATALGVSVGSVGSVVVNGGVLGTPSSGTLTNATGLPLSTGVTGTLAVANGGTGITAFGSGVATALGVNVGSAGAFVVNGGALGTPSSGTVTNLTGTASININGTVGATTPNTGSFTTLTTSSTVTHNGGTANGVAYLNGSKVLTTGSALTFTNGNTLQIDGGATGYLIGPTGEVLIGEDGSGLYIGTGFGVNPAIPILFGHSAITEARYSVASAAYHRWLVGTEQMRLTSTGLGIGTSSPAYKLDVNAGASGVYANFNSTNSSGGFLRLTNSGTVMGLIGAGAQIGAGNASDLNITSANNLIFGYNGGTRGMTLDSSGNLGLGVTPSAWGSSNRALQVATAGAIWSPGGADTRLSNNQYRNSASSRVYIANGFAQEYAQDSSGNHVWLTAPSGTAGNAISFTQAMTLASTGNLLVGSTADSGSKLQVGSSSGSTSTPTAIEMDGTYGTAAFNGLKFYLYKGASESYGFGLGGSADVQYWAGSSSTGMHRWFTSQTERARITSGGDFVVGSTTGDGYRIGAYGTFPLIAKMTGTATGSYSSIWHAATTGDNVFLYFSTETAYTTRGSITYNRGGGVVAYNTTSDYRSKDIIGPVTNPGAAIDALKVYMGKMKGATIERPMLIAHEAQEVTPYAVTGEKDAVNADGTPKYQQMDHQVLVPLLIAEIQSLRARVAQLEGK